MATIPTSNPVPSESPRDLKYNAGKIDEIVNSHDDAYRDRFGLARLTWAGIEKISKEAILSIGFIPLDSFEQGATITAPNQALRLESSGDYYRWAGDLPKLVAEGSTPQSSGGVGVNAWVMVTDQAIRSLLSSSSGTDYIGSGASSLTDQFVRSVRYFGAKGDGVSDDTQAIQSAFEWVASKSGGAQLYINAGQYRLTKKIEVQDPSCNAMIYGAGSSITSFVWGNGSESAGLVFGTSSKVRRLYISGLTLNTKIVTTNPAMWVIADNQGAKQFWGKDILAYGDGLLGTASDGYFGGGMLILEDANYPIFEDSIFYGVDGSRDNFLLVPNGVKLTARTGVMLVPHFINVSCSYVGYPFIIDSIHVPGVEGLIMDRCNGMCVYGAKFTAQNATNSAYYPPQYNISKTQIEFFDNGMEFNHVGAVTVDTSTFLHRPDSITVGKAIVLADVNRATITSIYAEHRPGTNMDGVYTLGNTNGVTVSNSTMEISSGNTAVAFAGSTRNSSVFNNKLASNTGLLYANISTLSSTNSSSIYSSTDESSVNLDAGFTLKTGSRVVTMGAGGSFTVNWIEGFHNQCLSVTATSGDAAAVSGAISIGTYNVTGFTGFIAGGTSGTQARINYTTLGR